LNEAGIGVEAVAVSAALCTQGRRAGDDELARMSGVAKVLEVLERIAADAERVSLRAVANHVLFALDQLAQMLQSRRSRLVRPGCSAQARAAARLAEERLDDLRTSSVRWQKLLRDSFATVTSDVDFDLRQGRHVTQFLQHGMQLILQLADGVLHGLAVGRSAMLEQP
jgi:hypothetical protein